MLWIAKFPISGFCYRTGYCDKTIRTAVKLLCKKKFITTHGNGYDRRFNFEVHLEVVKNYLQVLPLFKHIEDENEEVPSGNGYRMDAVTVTGSKRYPVPDASGNQCRMYIPSIPSLIPSSPSTDDAGIDEEKDQIIAQYRVMGIARETTEAYLTDHSRQKMRIALTYVRSRVDKIHNPAGMVLAFLKNPGQFGYELDKQGCWLPAKTVAARSRPQAAPSCHEQHDRQPTATLLEQWRQEPQERRQAAWEIMADTYRDQAHRWRVRDAALLDPPVMFLPCLQKNLEMLVDCVTTNE